MSNSEADPSDADQRRLLFIGLFVQAIAVSSKGLPKEAHVLEELGKLREEQCRFLNEVEQSAEESFGVLHRKLHEQFQVAAVSAVVSRHRARAAVAMARALTEAVTARSIEQKQLNNVAFNNLATISGFREAAKGLQEFAERVNKEVIQSSKMTRKNVRQATRASMWAIQRVLLRTLGRRAIRWILRNAIYLCWSLVACGIFVDLIQSYSEDAVRELLGQTFGLHTARGWWFKLWWFKLLPAVVIVSAFWLILDRKLKPRLERWQRNYDRSQLKRYTSDVFNAAFVTRAYRVTIEASRLGTQKKVVDVDVEIHLHRKPTDWDAALKLKRNEPHVPLIVYRRAPGNSGILCQTSRRGAFCQ